jgi:carbamoyl-phosphate synthase large subunit
MKTILVSGASGIVGYGTLRSLKRGGQDLRLIGTSMYTDSVAQGFCDLFVQAPPTNDPGYLDWLTATIAEHQVDLIIPGIEIDMYHWVEHVAEIEAAGARVLQNDVPLIHLCKDKWAFYERLAEANVACAIDSSLSDDYDTLVARCGLPFLLKPRRGFGSKGIVRVDSAATFARHRADMGAILMAQPIVGSDDEEYTTSAFCDGQGGLYAAMTLRRKLSRDGFTDKAEVVASDDFMDAIGELCRLLRPHGPTNFQFRRCADGVKLLEINPRISSSTSIRTAFGYNESAMAVAYYFDGTIPVQPAIRRGKAVRYTDDFIFYDDDSLHL